LESTLSPNLILLLQRDRNLKWEAERVDREKADEQAFQECEAELEQCVAKLVDMAKDTKKRNVHFSTFKARWQG
jgi:hypothetical protein